MTNLVDLDQMPIERLFEVRESFTKEEEKRIIKLFEEGWVEDSPYINAWNYWYYRYFTNKFNLYLLRYKYIPECPGFHGHLL